LLDLLLCQSSYLERDGEFDGFEKVGASRIPLSKPGRLLSAGRAFRRPTTVSESAPLFPWPLPANDNAMILDLSPEVAILFRTIQNPLRPRALAEHCVCEN
jgi:hypothetical protein